MRMSQLHVRLTCAVRLYVGFPGDVQQSALIQLSLCGFRYPLLLKLCRTLRRGHFYFNSWNIPSEIQTRKHFPVFSSQVFELTLDANAFIVYIRQMSHSEVPTVILSDFGSALFPAGCRSPNCSVFTLNTDVISVCIYVFKCYDFKPNIKAPFMELVWDVEEELGGVILWTASWRRIVITWLWFFRILRLVS